MLTRSCKDYLIECKECLTKMGTRYIGSYCPNCSKPMDDDNYKTLYKGESNEY